MLFLEHFSRMTPCFSVALELKEEIMSMFNRVLLALGVVTFDFAIFFVPLTAVFMAYILVYNPPWFREFLNTLDAGQGKSPAD